MKYLKLFENFGGNFGEQTNLEKQFSKIVVAGLRSNDVEFWSTFNALKMEIKDVIGKEDSLFQELMYRITDDQDPVKVMYFEITSILIPPRNDSFFTCSKWWSSTFI